MSYQCKLDIFEGPLDLLLHLIKEQKMDIYDIQVAEITRQYMEYLDVLRELNLEVVGEYLVIAAELTKIKSRLLLPQEETEEGEGIEGGEDPRAALRERLFEYQRYRDVAFKLRKREYEQQQLFSRKGGEIQLGGEGEVEPLIEASVFDLLSAFQKVLKEKSFVKDYEIEIDDLSVSDRISYIMEILNTSESAAFESLFTPLNTKREFIVTFLALLELMRLKLLRVEQSIQFQTIRIFCTADLETQEEVLKQFHESQDEENPE